MPRQLPAGLPSNGSLLQVAMEGRGMGEVYSMSSSVPYNLLPRRERQDGEVEGVEEASHPCL